MIRFVNCLGLIAFVYIGLSAAGEASDQSFRHRIGNASFAKRIATDRIPAPHQRAGHGIRQSRFLRISHPYRQAACFDAIRHRFPQAGNRAQPVAQRFAWRAHSIGPVKKAGNRAVPRPAPKPDSCFMRQAGRPGSVAFSSSLGRIRSSLALVKSDLAAKTIECAEGFARLAQIVGLMRDATASIQTSSETSPVPDIRGLVARLRAVA